MLITYATNEYPGESVPTVSDNFDINVNLDGTNFQLVTTDTAGGEEYDRLRPLSYSFTNVFLLCFAVNDMNSLKLLEEKYVPEIKLHCPDVPFLLVGTKQDLRNEEIPFTYENGTKKAKEIGAVKYMECSSLTGYNLKEVFNEATKAVKDEMAKSKPKPKGVTDQMLKYYLKLN